MSETKRKVPKLRFPGFTEDWEQRKLGEIVEKEIKGKAQEAMLGSETLYLDTEYLNGGIARYVDLDEDVQEDDLIILWDGSQAGTLYHGAKGALGSTLKAYRLTYDSRFIYQQMKGQQEIIFNRYRTPNIPHVIKTFTKEFIISITSEEEAKKIADILFSFDNLITLHQRKLESLKLKKKALLQKMFTKNGEQFPELRFPGFTDAWEQRKLIDYLKVSSDKNKDNKFGKADVLSVSGEYGIVNQIEFQGRSFAGVSVANYGVVEIGDVVYTKSPLKANPYGIIKTNKLSPGIVSTLYAVYKPLENIDSDFVQVYFEHDGRMNNYMKPLVNKGAKNDMKVTDENALKGDVIFPAKEEQEHIVKCFSTLDNLITLHQRKLEHLQLQKKALLQQMFV